MSDPRSGDALRPDAQGEGDVRARLADAERELSLLREELAETNRGVMVLYAELDDQAMQLRNVSELKSRFLSYVSHEFRTPLGAIQSLSRILLDRLDGPLTTEQERQVTFINSSALELSEMVNDQLDLAKIEAGRITVSPKWFEMIDLFSALRGMFKPIAVNPDVVLSFEEPVGVPPMYSDDQKLAQILRNFISNALKFTLHGKVVVRAELDGGDRGDVILFSVSDTGIGIPPEHLAHLFQDFSQVDSLAQPRLRGTGLGLAVCRRLARLLRGDVSVESTLGVGSRFEVRVPARLGEDDHA